MSLCLLLAARVSWSARRSRIHAVGRHDEAQERDRGLSAAFGLEEEPVLAAHRDRP